MAKQTINIGASANDGTGDPLRIAFDKVNSNFTELYNDESQGEVNSIIAGDGISVDTATGDVTITNTITNNNQLINGAGYVDGSGTANYIAKWADGDTIGNSVIYDDGTNVGIGTSSPATPIDVSSVSSTIASFRATGFGANNIRLEIGSGGDRTIFKSFQDTTNVERAIAFQTGNTERMRIDSSGNVGIGTTSPVAKLDVRGNSLFYANSGTTSMGITATSSNNTEITFGSFGASGNVAKIIGNSGGLGLIFNTNSAERMRITSDGDVQIGNVAGAKLSISGSVGTTNGTAALPTHTFYSDLNTGMYRAAADTLAFSTGGTERMRIDSSGKLLINTTNNNASGLFRVRQAADFNVATFTDGSAVGFVAINDDVSANVPFLLQGSDIRFNALGGTERMRITSNGMITLGDAVTVVPSSASVNVRLIPASDGTVRLGDGAERWEAVYAVNGTIITSDANEKQDIEDLSQVEINVAKSLKGLIKKFRYKDAVAKKGEDARIHFGVIAQEVQAAFETEGLDASRYGLFCSDTWWEKYVTSTNEEGVETSKREVYNEPTEGATEKTRLGIRYEELLAFVISAL